MTLKNDRLVQQIQNAQKFVTDRISQEQAYIGVDQALKDLGESLKAGKLALQIVGHDLAQVKALQKLLELNSELQDAYQLKISTLPELPDPNAPPPPPALVLQSSSEVQKPTCYELKTSQAQVIGRNPAIAQILLPDHINLTGGSHAELQPLKGGGWQIRDLGSRNGTFINGNSQKLQDWHPLKAGDQIFLGSASQATGSATLIFEVPSTDDIDPAYAEAQRLLDCNILCLVIPAQPLPQTIQRFIQLAKDTNITKLFIIVDKPGGMTVDTLKEALVEIENFIKSQLKNISFELVSLLLKPFTLSSGATIITPHAQPEFEFFCKNLKALSGEKTEAILTEWITGKLNQIVNQVEAILVQQDVALKERLQQDEARLKELSQGNFKKQTEKVYKKVDGERDSFFRQVKTELSQSKSSLLDEFRQSSLPYKIQQFTKQLQPAVSNQGGYCYVRLKVRARDTGDSSTNDVHAAATELCHTELTRWATVEWSRICREYVSGGLDAFFERSYESLNFIPKLMLPKDSFSRSQTLSIQSVLNVSNVEPAVELRYKKVNIWGYVSKTVRTNLMSILGMVTLLGGAVGVIARILGFEFTPDKALFALSLLPILFAAAIVGHKIEQQSKVEETFDKLQKEIVSYYQSYVKGLADRLLQRIGGLLEAEERRFRETLENVKEVYASHIAELDKAQSQLKSQLDEMKRSGSSKIEKDLTELRKLKQSL